MDEFGIIFHQRFPYVNLSEEEGDFYLSLILNSRELNESDRKIKNDNPCDFSLIQLKLVKKDDIVLFDGIIANDVENRGIDGTIKKIGNKSYIDMNILLFDQNYSKFSCIEKFKFMDSKIIRTTSYGIEDIEEKILPLFNEKNIYYFKQSIVDSNKKR